MDLRWFKSPNWGFEVNSSSFSSKTCELHCHEGSNLKLIQREKKGIWPANVRVYAGYKRQLLDGGRNSHLPIYQDVIDHMQWALLGELHIRASITGAFTGLMTSIFVHGRKRPTKLSTVISPKKICHENLHEASRVWSIFFWWNLELENWKERSVLTWKCCWTSSDGFKMKSSSFDGRILWRGCPHQCHMGLVTP